MGRRSFGIGALQNRLKDEALAARNQCESVAMGSAAFAASQELESVPAPESTEAALVSQGTAGFMEPFQAVPGSRVWSSAEYLLWWIQPASSPLLVRVRFRELQ